MASSQPRICGAWIETLPSLVGRGQNDYLHSAIKALGVSILARGSGGLAPVSDAMEAQNLALHSLQRNIHHASTLYANEVAATIMCLFMSEVVPSSTPRGLSTR